MATSAQKPGWERIWADLDALPAYWSAPEPSVVAWGEELWAAGDRHAGGRRVLDLGCGIGRHTVALARLGFSVAAADISPSGLATCAAWLAREGLSAAPLCQEMERFPFADGVFEGMVAYHVIYHTTLDGMGRVLAEARRVLRSGGRLYITALAREDSRVAGHRADVETGRCVELEPFTFIYLRDAPGDKYLPHHYCDEAELRGLLAGFVVDGLRLDHRRFTDESGALQTGAHYHVQARRV